MSGLLFSHCENEEWDLAEMLIDQEIGLEYLDPDTNESALSILFKFNQFRLAEKYMSKEKSKLIISRKDYNDEFPISYGNESMNELRLRAIRLNKNQENYQKTTSIKQFQNDEFTNMSDLVGEGSFGSVYYANHPELGYVAIKSFKRHEDEEILYSGFCEEMTLYQMVNRENSACPKIYGFFIEDDSANIVMEPLAFTLSDINKIFKTLDRQTLEDYLLEFTYKLCEKLYLLNSIGINSNDIKSGNIMIDFQGNVKIIDLSISEYFGLNPFNFLNKGFGTRYITPPDGDKKNTQLYIEGIHNFKTLNSDVYSAGVCIANFYFRTYYKIYYFKDGQIYRTVKDATMEEIQQYEIQPYNDNDFTRLLCKMIHHDPNRRLFAKECINQPIFGKNEIVRLSADLSPTHYRTRTNYDKICRELIYYDEITNANLNFNLNPCSYNGSVNNYLNLFNCILDSRFSYTCVFNSILFAYNMQLESTRRNIDIAYAILSMVSFQTSENVSAYQLSLSDRRLKLKTLDYFQDYFYSFKELYEFIPIECCIFGLAVDLQSKGYGGVDVTEIVKDIKTVLLRFIIYNAKYNVNVYQLIMAIFEIIIDDGNVYASPELVDSVREIMVINNGNIRNSLIDQVSSN